MAASASGTCTAVWCRHEQRSLLHPSARVRQVRHSPARECRLGARPRALLRAGVLSALLAFVRACESGAAVMHDEYVYPQWLDTSDNDQLERAVISYHAKG